MLIAELAAALAMSSTYLFFGLLFVLELVVTAAGLALEALVTLALRGRESAIAPSRPLGARLRKLAGNRWVRRITIASGVCLLLTAAAALILNFFFFDWSARQLAKGAAARAGVDIGFASAEGNLFTGRIVLRDVTLVRRSPAATAIDLRARELAVDLDLRSMVWGPRRVEDARVVGMRGTVERTVKPSAAPSAPAAPAKPWYVARPTVHIDRLLIEESAIEYIDHIRGNGSEPFRLPIVIDRFAADGMRTTWLAFDVLFRANGSGQIAGRPFSVSNSGPADVGRRTTWRFDRLPATVLGDYVGGPFGWLVDGEVNVAATTAWGDPPRSLDMDWSFEFANVRAEVPPDLQGWRRRLAAAFVDHVNAKGERLPLAFTFKMDAGRYEGAASAEAAGLWSSVADAATRELAAALKVDQERVDELKQDATNLIRRFRKKGAEPATTQP